MTEEIIVNDVNVAGCEFLRNCIIPDNYGCKIDDSLCCDVGNCYYKQFKRLEQENKRYKQLLQGCPADGNDCGFCEIDKQNKELEQENKELKKENETLNYQWHKQSEIGDEWYKVAEKYKTALEEIRDFAKDQNDIWMNDIVNKINETLGNKENKNV